LLLVFNIGIDQLQKKDDVVVKTEDYTFEIDSLFNSVLDNYGIEKVWRKKTFIENKKYDSLKYIYKISLPKELTVAEIVRAENFAFVNSHSVFNSEELKNYGKTKIEISSSKQLKFEAYLTIDTNLYRSKSKISILIKIDNISDTTVMRNILSSSFALNIMAVPSNQLMNIKQIIKSRNKGYSVLLSDNIEDSKYVLDTGFSKKKLSRNIKAIVKDFSDARSFIIQDNSELAKSMLYSYVVSQFRKLNKKIIKMSHFILLTSNDKADVLSRFSFYLAGTDTSQVNKIILTLSNFNMLLPKIKSSIKKGIKFI